MTEATIEQRMFVFVEQMITNFRLIAQSHAIWVKNSGAVAVGTGVAALGGFCFWWLAARSFPPEVIGTASALISLMALGGLIGEGGLGTMLTGEVIRWPDRKPGLISAALLVSLALSLVGGGFILVLSELIAPKSDKFDNFLLFIGFGLTGISIVTDQAFVGMLQSTFRMLHQFLFSILKLSFLVVAAIWFYDETSILFSWIAALVVSQVLIELLMRRRGQSLLHQPDFELLYMLRRKTVDHYMLDLGVLVPITIMPYLVMILLSPARNAVFTVIWMVVSVASIVPGAMTIVLFPAIRATPNQYKNKMGFSLGLSLLFSIVFGLFIYFFSTEILTVFNPAYVELGSSHLRFLGFGLMGITIKYHVLTAARLNNYMRQASIWFCLAGIFELTCVAIGCHIGRLEGLSTSWTIAMLVEGGVMLLLVSPLRERQVRT
jgi:O-antigen/teichoic acid export membrane protein